MQLICFTGYLYAGLQWGVECRCGNSGYDRYGNGTGCNLNCNGNASQICGGSLYNSVYAISMICVM